MNDTTLGSRSFSGRPTKGIVTVHDPIVPVEIYKGESITATIVDSRTKERLSNLHVYRLSPLGAEIDITNLPNSPLRVGAEVDLTIVVAKQPCTFFGIAVNSIHSEQDRKLVGIRWFLKNGPRDSTVERRETTRWLCGDHFLPTGVAPNPARFNDFVYFSILDISRGGMQLSTSMRNKFLIPGMVLESVVSFPLIGQISLHLRITNARLRARAGTDFLALGAEVVDTAPELLEIVGQYLLQFGPQLSLIELKKEGFAVKSMQSAVEFSFVKTLEDYREVLELRRLTYSQVNKADTDAPLEAMSDIFDAKSRIIMARHKGELVGSMRVTFHANDESNEYEQFVTFPPNFPRRDELAVASRVCTHPDYRGSDLMYGLIRQCVLTVLQSKRKYILGGGMERLVPVYEKLGFRRQGLFFSHQSLKGVKEEILLANVFNMISGIDTSPAVWNEIYSDLINYISYVFDMPLTPAMNLRMRLYKSVSSITRIFTSSVRRPKRRNRDS